METEGSDSSEKEKSGEDSSTLEKEAEVPASPVPGTGSSSHDSSGVASDADSDSSSAVDNFFAEVSGERQETSLDGVSESSVQATSTVANIPSRTQDLEKSIEIEVPEVLNGTAEEGSKGNSEKAISKPNRKISPMHHEYHEESSKISSSSTPSGESTPIVSSDSSDEEVFTSETPQILPEASDGHVATEASEVGANSQESTGDKSSANHSNGSIDESPLNVLASPTIVHEGSANILQSPNSSTPSYNPPLALPDTPKSTESTEDPDFAETLVPSRNRESSGATGHAQASDHNTDYSPTSSPKITAKTSGSSDDSDNDTSFEEEYDEYIALKKELVELKKQLLDKISQLEDEKKSEDFNMDKYLEHCQLLNDYTNLPSFDFEKRLKLIKMFYPNMNIVDVSRHKDVETSNQSLSFTISFIRLASFRVQIVFDKSDEKVMNLSLSKTGSLNITTEYDQIEKLIKYCEAQKDVSLFIYALNSYIHLFKCRSQLWMDLFAKYFEESVSINGYTKVEAEGKNTRLLAYALLRSSSSFELTKEKKEIVFHWDFFFPMGENYNETIVGDCQSEMKCFVFVESENGKDDAVLDLTETLKGLVKSDGTYKGFSRLIESMLV
ncbi:hypothetical protein FOA43_000527 [Brettanomyces nanus]|uniref:Uncharacterized protein n=1 Tax=Eeniella nana TaxID=13502 RepID=A0A875RN65_EENNA|nr:uncharacterized protein FOA43_000527 [Brettanomyces nanus]QPG73220.1 hypothetical protein FOA43_000527 [Brettanomyces nanus]